MKALPKRLRSWPDLLNSHEHLKSENTYSKPLICHRIVIKKFRNATEMLSAISRRVLPLHYRKMSGFDPSVPFSRQRTYENQVTSGRPGCRSPHWTRKGPILEESDPFM